MGWVKRRADEVKTTHNCPVPMRAQYTKAPVPCVNKETGEKSMRKLRSPNDAPDGDVGDIWACDTCGQVWKIIVPPAPRYRYGYAPHGFPEWRHAGWRDQKKYAPTYSCGCVVGGKPKCPYATGRLPGAGSITVHGVSRSRLISGPPPSGSLRPPPPKGGSGQAAAK